MCRSTTRILFAILTILTSCGAGVLTMPSPTTAGAGPHPRGANAPLSVLAGVPSAGRRRVLNATSSDPGGTGTAGSHGAQVRELAWLMTSKQGRVLVHSGLGSALLAALTKAYGGLRPASRVTGGAIAPRARKAASRVRTRSAHLYSPVAARARPGAGKPLTLFVTNLPPGPVAPRRYTPSARGRRQHAFMTVRVYTTIEMLPRRSPPNGRFTLTGSGFAAGQVMRFIFQQGHGSPVLLGLGGTDSTGTLIPERLWVPLTALPGPASILVQGDAGAGARLALTIIPLPVTGAPVAVRQTPVPPHPAARPYHGHSTMRRVLLRPRITAVVQLPRHMRLATLTRIDTRRAGAPAPAPTPTATSSLLPPAGVYSATVGGFTLSAPAMPISGIVRNVTLTPPAALRIKAFIILSSVAVDEHGQPTLPLQVPDFHLDVDGFVVTATTALLDASGLTTTLAVSLPAAQGSVSMKESGVVIDPSGTFAATLAPQTLNTTIAGFPLTLHTFVLTNQALTVGAVDLQLPDAVLPAGAKHSRLKVTHVQLHSDGSFSMGTRTGITLPSFKVRVKGFSVTLDAIDLTPVGIAVRDAEFPLPRRFLPSGVGAITATGSLTITRPPGQTTLITGTLSVAPPAIIVAGFTVTAHRITLDSATGLQIINARLALPRRILARGVALPTLEGTVSVTHQYTVSGSLSAPAFTLELPGGFAVSAAGTITLNDKGLHLEGQLQLPGEFLPAGIKPIMPRRVKPIDLEGQVTVTREYTVTASLAATNVSLDVGGLAVEVGRIELDKAGLRVLRARLVLPALPATPFIRDPITFKGKLSITNAAQAGAITPTYVVAGSLETHPFTITVAGFALHVQQASLDSEEGLLLGAQLTLKKASFANNKKPITLRGTLGVTVQRTDTVTPTYVVTGSLETTPFTFTAAGFTVRVQQASLSSEEGLLLMAQLILPQSSYVDKRVTFGGALSVTAKQTDTSDAEKRTYAVSGRLRARPFTLTVAGYGVTVQGGARFDSETGLLLTAQLTLSMTMARNKKHKPRDSVTFNGRLRVMQTTSVTETTPLTPTYVVTGVLTVQPFTITVAGAALSVQGRASFTSARGLTVAIKTTLSALGGRVLRGSLTIGPDFSIMGQIALKGTTKHPLSFAYGGFTASARAVTLDGMGVHVLGVRITVPRQYFGPAVTLTGALTVTVSGLDGYLTLRLDGRTLTLPGLKLTVGAERVTVGTGGLVVTKPVLDLSQRLTSWLHTSTITLQRLAITPSGHLELDSTPQGVEFSVAHTTIKTGQLKYCSGGSGCAKSIVAPGATITLPEALGGKTYRWPNFGLPERGPISEMVTTTTPLAFTIADMRLSARDFSVQDAAVVIGRVTLTLPIFQGGVTLHDLSYNGTAFGLKGGNAHVALPPINVGGFAISGAADVTLTKSQNGAAQYHFKGSGMLYLAGIGQFNCTLEIGSITPKHPYSNLYEATLKVVAAAGGIPIGSTGLVINGISGAMVIGNHVTVELRLHIATADGGYLFAGHVGAAASSDGNFGASGGGRLFKLLAIDGGFCVRFVAEPDGVCRLLLPRTGTAIDAGRGLGLYAEISFRTSVTARKPIDVYANADAHLWLDNGGPQIEATAALGITIPAGAVFWWLPWDDHDIAATAILGTFRNNTNVYRGIKFSAFGYPVFVDSSLAVHLSGDDYAQVQSSSGGSAMGALLRSSSRPVRVRLRVLRGQTNAYVTLAWRGRMPALTLGAPNGQVYRPNGPGVATYLASKADLRSAPIAYSGAVTLYFPQPRQGVWTATLSNLAGNAGYEVMLNAVNPPPELSITVPATGTVLVAAPDVTLRGTATFPTTPTVPSGGPMAGERDAAVVSNTVTAAGPAPSVSLYYTTAATTVITSYGTAGSILTQTMPLTVPNYSGTEIASGVPLHGGRWSYQWDTHNLPSGIYSVYAILDDGEGPAVEAYASGRVQVRQPGIPDPPLFPLAVHRGNTLHLFWAAPQHSTIIDGYALYWRTSSMKRYSRLDLGNAHTFTLNEANEGAPYAVSLRAYDQAGYESTAVYPGLAHPTRQGVTYQIRGGGASVGPGGEVTIPLVLQPKGRDRDRLSDYVALTVRGVPKGVAAALTLEEANLFATYAPSDPSAPAIRLVVADTVKPTRPRHPYVLVVSARQEDTGRIETATISLTVTGAGWQANGL